MPGVDHRFDGAEHRRGISSAECVDGVGVGHLGEYLFRGRVHDVEALARRGRSPLAGAIARTSAPSELRDLLEVRRALESEASAGAALRGDAADVERLRFVLSAQRDRFWPLKVIRERLDALDRGLEVGHDGDVAPPPRPQAERPDRLAARAGQRPLRLTAIELQHAADIDTGTFRELVSYGLLPKGRDHFDADDLGVARACGSLVAAGVDVRHLRPFKSAAERADLIAYLATTTQ